MKKYIVFSGIGFELLIIMTVLISIGQELDRRQQTQGVFVILGVVIGFTGWLFHIIYLLKKLNVEDNSPKKSEKS